MNNVCFPFWFTGAPPSFSGMEAAPNFNGMEAGDGRSYFTTTSTPFPNIINYNFNYQAPPEQKKEITNPSTLTPIQIKPTSINFSLNQSNPMISECDIKVLYVGENRNGICFSKTALEEIAKTLPGSPIVGYYDNSKKDFTDHAEELIIRSTEIIYNKKTIPYGFVNPSSDNYWFQTFTWEDGTTKEYLMTKGYLWTGRYPQAQQILEEGQKSVSAEIKPVENGNNYMTADEQLFIVNDAMFSAICVLGDDVEPCYEDAKIQGTAMPLLFQLAKELKTFSLSSSNNLKKEDEATMDTTEKVENAAIEQTLDNAKEDKKSEADAKVDEKKTEVKDDKAAKQEENKKEDTAKQEEKEDEKKRKELNNSLDADKLQQMALRMAELEKQNAELIEFKRKADDKEKMDLINSFYMLSDDDKKDVIANRMNFSLQDIKAQLAIMCFDKKLNLSEVKDEENSEAKTENFNLNVDNKAAGANDSLPEWAKAVVETQKEMA